MQIREQDLLYLAFLIGIWVAVVVSNYATALHLRRTLDIQARAKRLYLYTRSRWEANFLIAALVIGAAAGLLLRTSVQPLVLILAGGVAATLSGLLSLLIANGFKYAGDISEAPARAVVFSVLGVVVFVGTTLTFRYIEGNGNLPDNQFIWAWITQIGGVIGLIAGLLSSWKQLMKTVRED